MIHRTLYMLVGYYLTLGFFGVFGLVLSFLALLCGPLPATNRTERFFQRMIHRCLALFVWWTTVTRLTRVRYHGLDRLSHNRRGLVLVANHPSLIDITCLLARVPEAVCIFKPAIRRNPLFGAAARRAGYLANDGGHEVIRHATEKVSAGHTLIVFPEGTRTPVGQMLLPLRPGFALIARRSCAPVQLVRITSNKPVLSKGSPWWRPPPSSVVVDVTIGPRLTLREGADPAAAAVEIATWFRSTPEAAACQRWSPTFSLDDASASAS